jgi:hypothetical protein
VDRRSDCERRVLAEHAGSENALTFKVESGVGEFVYLKPSVMMGSIPTKFEESATVVVATNDCIKS